MGEGMGKGVGDGEGWRGSGIGSWRGIWRGGSGNRSWSVSGGVERAGVGERVG